jgi:hypothetical protein
MTRLVVGGLDLFVFCLVAALSFVSLLGVRRVMVLGDAFSARILLLVATYQSLLLEMPA